MKKLRKFLTVGVMVLSIIAMSGLTVNTAQAAAQPGDLIKMDGLSSVYYLGNDGKRYVFPSESVYFSWYNDFSGVITIPASELQSYPLGANVTMRPGTKLVKITTDPSVYAVTPNGVLRKIQSEADAIALYGPNWNKMVVDIADAFFTNYTIGTPLNSGEYPAGTLLKNPNNASIYYFDGTNYRMISSEAAFNANRFNMNNVVTTSMTLTASGTAITGAEDLAKPYGATSGQVTNGNLMVSLAANTPAANSIPTNTSVDMMKFNLTAGNDAAANVSGIKFTASGLGDYKHIKEVTVYADGKKLGNSRDVDSNKVAQINFTENLVIAAGTTKTLTVRANVTGTQNYGLSIVKASDISATAVVAGSFPIESNIMSGVSVTVGKLTFDNDGSLSNVKLGDSAATVAKFKVTNDNVEDITLNTISLKKDSVSTASDSDMNNFKLFVDGTQVAATDSISSKYITFVFSSPVVVPKNNVKRFVVKADVVSGASKTMKFFLDAKADVTAVGSFYGYNSLVANNLTGNTVTIDAGQVTLEKVNATVDKLKKDTNDTILGTIKLTVNSGKNVEMSKMKLHIKSVNDVPAGAEFAQIENVEIFNKTNNTTYDLSYASESGTTKIYENNSLGLILNSGVTYELVVRADVKATANNGDYEVSIANAASDLVMKETGNDTLITDITPNALTLKKVIVYAPAVTFSTNALSATYSAVAGTSDVEVLNFNTKANESSDLKITELKVAKQSGSALVNSGVVSEFKLWKDGVLLKSVSGSQISNEEVSFSDLNQLVLANTTNSYKVTASLVKDSSNNGQTMQFRLSGYSVEETDKGTAAYDAVADPDKNGVIVSGTMVSARTVTIVGTGTLYVSIDNTISGLDKDSYAKAGSNDVAVASLKLKASNEDVKVTKVKVTADGITGLNSIVNKLALYDGSTLVAETSNISDVTEFTNTNFVVPQSEKIYTLKASLNKIGKDMPGVLNKDLEFKFLSLEAEGNSSGDTLAADTTNGVLAGEIAYDANANNTFGEAADTSTAKSKKVGVVASKISAVSLEQIYNGIAVNSNISSGVAANAAIIKVTVDSSDNTLANGNAIKTLINKVKVNVENNVTSYTASIEKIGGTQAAIGGVVSGDYAQFVVSGTDYELAPSSSAYYLVKVVPTFTGLYAGDRSIKVNLDKLDGTDDTNSANGGNIIWKDSSDNTTAKNDLRLSTNNVTGILITN